MLTGHVTGAIRATLRRRWAMTVGLALCLLGQTAIALLQPWPIREIIDRLATMDVHQPPSPEIKHSLAYFFREVVSRFVTSLEYDFIFIGVGLTLLLGLGGAILVFLQQDFLARLGSEATHAVREAIFQRLLNLPTGFFERSRAAELAARVMGDALEVQNALEGLLTIFLKSLPIVIGIVAVTFRVDAIYALVFIAIIPVAFFANLRLNTAAKAAARRWRAREGLLAASVNEAFCQHKAVTTMCLAEEIADDFSLTGQESAEEARSVARLQGALAFWVELTLGGATAFAVLLGAVRILHGCMSIGHLTVFLAYLAALFKPIREAGKFIGRWSKSRAALERLEDAFDVQGSDFGAVDLPSALPAPCFEGDIRFEGVSFCHHDRMDKPVLEGFELKVAKGSKVALVGASGSGKSTALSLLARLKDPDKGVIRVDGRDIREFTLASLRDQMSFVMQDSFLFNSTIRENIGLARKEATEEEIIEAARLAGAHEFIWRLPLGYDTPLGDFGSGLSGGQRRRIAIARAFLRRSPILLLDEPTVGLDPTTEAEVMDSLWKLAETATTIIVTHNLATITRADAIHVLSGGRIVESGTHEELLALGARYKELWGATS